MLTDTHCRNAKPREKLYRLNDQRGLYLEVKPNGVKAWRYRFTLNGKASMLRLANTLPLRSLKPGNAARPHANWSSKASIPPSKGSSTASGKPAKTKNTFEIVAKEWLQTKDWEDVTKKRRLDMLERVVFPSIGNMPVREITPAHILDIAAENSKAWRPPRSPPRRGAPCPPYSSSPSPALQADSVPVWPVAQGATSEQDPAHNRR